MVSIIVACDSNFVIGVNGTLPWRVPDDLKMFRERTMGCPIIMGRNTWNSIPKKPLDGRANIVISHSLWARATDPDTGPFYFSSLSSALTAVKCGEELATYRDKEVFIIGGAKIYKTALELGVVDRIFMSKIDQNYKGDVYFPALGAEWQVTQTEYKSGFNLHILKKNVPVRG